MDHFKLKFDPVADPQAVIMAGNARFTVLTERVIRMEYSATGEFEDRPSQVFWYRRQPVPSFEQKRDGDVLEIGTNSMRLRYIENEAGFTADTLSVTLNMTGEVWHPGKVDPDNLLGTTRTLDDISGQTVLEKGLLSKAGWVLIDDSNTLVFDENGWLHNRPAGRIDQYLFHYGLLHQLALDDYFLLAGRIPLLPRWVLGNWWSRFWAYTQDELIGLMREFYDKDVPLSVCIVDMDWHITETGNESSGWTGYTWNRTLFPNPKGLIDTFHEMGLRTALNLHPALGVWPHEEQYADFAKFMGQTDNLPVKFDITDPRFTQAYFELLHHPQEAMGVDFWWLDWQQGKVSSKEGLDPLWWLNHLHYYDLGRDGSRRPFIFSRWGGLGNHRYPIGFSGDTLADWDTLAYQPYFTATAANVGYGWWSHDIGGHYRGVKDPELYVRWVQFGVFSPIMRLHSTKNRFDERLPWAYGHKAFEIARRVMQLRHALIPYLYTMSWRAWQTGQQPIVPMYHFVQDVYIDAAYACPNQYTFGSELIAAPQVLPADPDIGLGRQVVWMPPGNWYHFFTGEQYIGEQWHAIYSTLDEIPVFAKAGAIVPLGPMVGWGGVNNPDTLDVYIFPGDGEFTLYEDDGVSMAYLNGAHSLTQFYQSYEGNRLSLRVSPVEGQRDHLPPERSMMLHFRGIGLPEVVDVLVNGREPQTGNSYDAVTETLSIGPILIRPDDLLMVELRGQMLLEHRDRRSENSRRLIESFYLDSLAKQMLWDRLDDIVKDIQRLGDMVALLSDTQIRALIEVIAGAGVHQFTNASPEHQPVVIWNNTPHSIMTYHLAQRDGWMSAKSEGGMVPRYRVWDFVGEREWRLNVSLGNLATVTLKHQIIRND